VKREPGILVRGQGIGPAGDLAAEFLRRTWLLEEAIRLRIEDAGRGVHEGTPRHHHHAGPRPGSNHRLQPVEEPLVGNTYVYEDRVDPPPLERRDHFGRALSPEDPVALRSEDLLCEGVEGSEPVQYQDCGGDPFRASPDLHIISSWKKPRYHTPG
jgi:hypothetical protein